LQRELGTRKSEKMNKSELINKVKALDGLSQDERAYLINLVNTKKKYGLVWEEIMEDKEEELRTQLPVLKEVKEKRILAQVSPRITEAPTLFNENEEPELDHQEFDLDNNNEITYQDAPNHILIEGDNLHALTALSFTHAGKIDVIYIDPPYNTGNKDFKYNDSFVDKDNEYRHSTWLSFMHKRLLIAKDLMDETGVILISIDDNEVAQLKLLCNEVYGESNFIAEMIWEQGKKHIGKFVGINHEYVLVYANNKSAIDVNFKKWKQKKEGLDKIYKIHNTLTKKHGDDYKKIELGIQDFYKTLPENDPAYSSKHYSKVDARGLFFAADISQGTGNGPRYDVLHPKTQKVTSLPSGGWRYSFETMQKLLKEDRIYFGEDETKVPCRKRYLLETEYELPSSVFYKDGRSATSQLEQILTKKVFNNPKDKNIIANFLNYKNNKIILDFFAGSGTTLHATIELNAEDGGKRQCILVTNDENNICEEVTYERVKRVIQGYTNAKGIEIGGLTNNNLRYYKTDFVPSLKTEANRRRLTELCTELLCIKEDCYTDLTITHGFDPKQSRIMVNNTGNHYCLIVYYSRNMDNVCAGLVDFIKGVKNLTSKIRIYAFSPEQDSIGEEFVEVAEMVETLPLPEAIYNAYKSIFKTLKLDKTTLKSVDNEVIIDTASSDFFNNNKEQE